MATKPSNGAIIVVNPRNGYLYLKVIHASVWCAQKRISQLAKWKSCEEVSNLIRALPYAEQPKKLIVTRKGLLDPMEIHLIDYPNIVITGTDIDIPFQALLKLEKFGQIILKATESILIVFNIFDDWLESVSSYTAFSRFILIIRSLHLNFNKASMIVHPDRSVRMNKSFLWPSLSDRQWIVCEQALKDLIISDYCIKNNVSCSDISPSDVRDIIIGAELEITKDNRREFEGKNIERADDSGTLIVVSNSVNKLGQAMVVSSSSPYETQDLNTSND